LVFWQAWVSFMAHHNIVRYAMSCSKRAKTYFPNGARVGMLFGITIDSFTYFGEYAPCPGVHTHTIDDVMAMLKTLNPDAIQELIVTAGESLPVLADYFSIYPYPASYVLSMAHAHRLFSASLPLKGELRLSALIESCDVHEAVLQAQAYVAQGYSCLKIKVGQDIVREIDKIKRIADVAGQKVSIRLDANKKLNLDQACLLLSRLGRMKIEYFEEPLDDFSQNQILHHEFGVAIGIDESFLALFDEQELNVSTAQFFIIKPSRFHSIYQAMLLAQRAKACGIEPILSTSFESDFSSAITAILADRLVLLGRAHGILMEDFFKSSPLTIPLRSFRGRLFLPAVADFLREAGSSFLPYTETFVAFS
jgi:o-succinylbenzoate synthase